MIFLTKFKAVGFKSFATNVNLDFTSPMSGVVGPNGSGKSNIVDAIK
jgi:chromosome segregation protein